MSMPFRQLTERAIVGFGLICLGGFIAQILLAIAVLPLMGPRVVPDFAEHVHEGYYKECIGDTQNERCREVWGGELHYHSTSPIWQEIIDGHSFRMLLAEGTLVVFSSAFIFVISLQTIRIITRVIPWRQPDKQQISTQ